MKALLKYKTANKAITGYKKRRFAMLLYPVMASVRRIKKQQGKDIGRESTIQHFSWHIREDA